METKLPYKRLLSFALTSFAWFMLGLFVASLILNSGPLSLLSYGMIRNLMFFPVIGLLFIYRFKREFLTEQALKWALIISVVIGISSVFKTVSDNFTNPHEWDFLCWYIDGSVAVRDLNFYEPAIYYRVTDELDLPVEPGGNFKKYYLDIAFKYPPQTMLLLFPLGYFDFFTAQAIWTVVLLFFLGGCIFLSKKIFFKDYSNLPGWLFSASLLLLFPKIKAILHVQQTTIILLFIVLLMYKLVDDNKAGIWLALGAVVKPIAAIWGIFFLIKRKWKAILYGFFTMVFLTVLTVLVFGWPVMQSYIFDHNASEYPFAYYINPWNQSLTANLTRLAGLSSENGSPLLSPLNLAVMLGIVFTTGFAIHKTAAIHNKWSICLALVLSVIIYPHTPSMYYVLTLPAVMLLLTEKELPLRQEFAYVIVVIYSVFMASTYFSFYGLVLFSGALFYIVFNLDKVISKEPSASLVLRE